MFKRIFHYFLIKKSGQFNSSYYLLNYPDVRSNDIDPLWHYINFGWKENRNPSEAFDTKFYLDNNPDVRQSGINPLIHYIKHGYKEGRITKSKKAEKLKEAISKEETRTLINEKVFQKIKRQACSQITDIIICVGAKPENFLKCYQSIKQHTAEETIFVNIVIHENDLGKLPDKILNEINVYTHNMGFFNFARANNIVISRTSNDVVLLNDDTVVTEGWLEKLRSDSKGVGLTGAHTGEHCSGNPDMWGNGSRRLTYKPINMFCAYIPRKLINHIGLLDENFVFYGGEDVDYSIRSLINGFPLIISEAFVIHNKNQSYGETKDDLLPFTNKILFHKYGNIKPYDLSNLNPTVSIIFLLNQSSHISQTAIKAFFSQYQNIELICIYQGNNEEALRIIRQCQNQNMNIRVILLPKVHQLAEIRRFGIKASLGQFVGFSKQIHDLGGKIKEYLEYLIIHPTISIIYNNNGINQMNDFLKLLSLQIEDEEHLPEQFNTHSEMIFGRKHIIEKISFNHGFGNAISFDWLVRTHREGIGIGTLPFSLDQSSHRNIELNHSLAQNQRYFKEILEREKLLLSTKRKFTDS